MSRIITRSLFYYGTSVNNTNQFLDFKEGATIYAAVLNIGDYSPTELADEITRAMNVVGVNVYAASFNRTTRKITIFSADGTTVFSLLTHTGTHAASAIWTVLGMSQTADKTGAHTYTGDTGAGSEYETQYPMDSYVAPNDLVTKETATVNTSPSGVVEQIDFGDTLRMQGDIRLITNRTGLNMPTFKEDASGVANFRLFIAAALTKARIEFMPDSSDRNTFFEMYLESTADDKSGLKFQLKNMKTPDFLNTGVLTFRGVT